MKKYYMVRDNNGVTEFAGKGAVPTWGTKDAAAVFYETNLGTQIECAGEFDSFEFGISPRDILTDKLVSEFGGAIYSENV